MAQVTVQGGGRACSSENDGDNMSDSDGDDEQWEGDEAASSAKMRALMVHVKRLNLGEASSGVGGGGKSPVMMGPSIPRFKAVIVSNFTTMLDAIAANLKEEGIRFVVLQGSTSNQKRKENLDAFQQPLSGPCVFLMSLKAGGVGITLTAADHLFLMDPWWNCAVEDQCIDRIYRLGQTRPVHIVKFTVENSVEERILVLQEKKRGLMKAALNKQSAAELKKMKAEDIKFLMIGK